MILRQPSSLVNFLQQFVPDGAKYAPPYVFAVLRALVAGVVISSESRKTLTVVGLEVGAKEQLGLVLSASRLALIVGGEGKGLSRSVRLSCHCLVSVATGGRVSSLNAAMACGIALYEQARTGPR